MVPKCPTFFRTQTYMYQYVKKYINFLKHIEQLAIALFIGIEDLV